MAPKDAEMPTKQAISADLEEMAKHITAIRADVEHLTGAIARAGGHQMHRVQDKAGEAVSSLETAVRRDPLTSLGVALGLGFLFGILTRR